jgi:hypothetical protein
MQILLRKLAFAFGFAGTIGGLAIIFAQLISWLQFNEWPQISVLHLLIAFGLRPRTSTWPIMQWIINVVMDFPISVVVFVVGLGLKQLFSSYAADYQRRGNKT